MVSLWYNSIGKVVNDMIKSFKTRLFPTEEQTQLLWKHINHSRFVWNYGLNLQNERYKNIII